MTIGGIIFAAIGTFLLFILIELLMSIRQFYLFKKIRTTLVVTALKYLKETPTTFVDLNILQNILLCKLKETKMDTWIEDIKISWRSGDDIHFVFELNFEKLKPRYQFVIGLSDVERLSLNSKKGIS